MIPQLHLLINFISADAVVIDSLEAQTPGIFGPNGGYARFLSLTSMLYPVGSFVGPLLAGLLIVNFGYLILNLVMGEFRLLFSVSLQVNFLMQNR